MSCTNPSTGVNVIIANPVPNCTHISSYYESSASPAKISLTAPINSCYPLIQDKSSTPFSVMVKSPLSVYAIYNSADCKSNLLTTISVGTGFENKTLPDPASTALPVAECWPLPSFVDDGVTYQAVAGLSVQNDCGTFSVANGAMGQQQVAVGSVALWSVVAAMVVRYLF
ncbi:hypothetical protein HKX48_002500 [Thoreauomyces humboldtii]|nr:hypothetical protein HKX48_002500 [Thoreauomyces humboldtii]